MSNREMEKRLLKDLRQAARIMAEVETFESGQSIMKDAADRIEALEALVGDMAKALERANYTIDDYLAYEHDGDPWTEDRRAMREMDIDDYARDGRLEAARAALAKRKEVIDQ